MKPLVCIREALEDPNLLGRALEGPTWHAWRSLLIAAMGEPLKPDEMEAFTKITGRTEVSNILKRLEELEQAAGTIVLRWLNEGEELPVQSEGITFVRWRTQNEEDASLCE